MKTEYTRNGLIFHDIVSSETADDKISDLENEKRGSESQFSRGKKELKKKEGKIDMYSISILKYIEM